VTRNRGLGCLGLIVLVLAGLGVLAFDANDHAVRSGAAWTLVGIAVLVCLGLPGFYRNWRARYRARRAGQTTYREKYQARREVVLNRPPAQIERHTEMVRGVMLTLLGLGLVTFTAANYQANYAFYLGFGVAGVLVFTGVYCMLVKGVLTNSGGGNEDED
jgi:predicted tellurium resistance membrane protein TerC